MGFKQIRDGRITHVGVLPKYTYENRDGVPTLVDLAHIVQVVVEVQDGPDKGREIRIELPGLEPVELARNLELAQHEAHAKTEALDGLDAPETAEQTA